MSVVLLRVGVSLAKPCDIDIEVSGHARPGFFVFSGYQDQDLKASLPLRILNEKGQCWQRDQSSVAWDFHPHPEQDPKFFSFMNASYGLKNYTVSGARTLLNTQFEVLGKISEPVNSILGPVEFDGHDFNLYSMDQWVALYYLPVIDWDGLFTIQSRVVLKNIVGVQKEINIPSRRGLIFDDRLYPSRVYSYQVAFRGQACEELSHTNRIQWIPEQQALLLSNFQQREIVFEPLNSFTQSWVLGGTHDEFHIPVKAQFKGSHGATWDWKTGRLLLLDDGYPASPLRALEFQLDPVAKKIISWKELMVFPGTNRGLGFIQRCGSDCFDITTGIYKGPNLVEIDDHQNIKFSISLKRQGEKLETYRIYRVNKIDVEAFEKSDF